MVGRLTKNLYTHEHRKSRVYLVFFILYTYLLQAASGGVVRLGRKREKGEKSVSIVEQLVGKSRHDTDTPWFISFL